MRKIAPLVIVTVLVVSFGCSALSELGVVKPPRVTQAEGRPAELRLHGPSSTSRIGGATVRLWAQVENPNPFGVLLDRLDGTFFLEDARAARVDFPFGLELGARDEAVVPLDLTLDFDDLSTLADVLRGAIDDREVGYRLEGTIGVDAGPLGDLTFGPTDWLEGELVASAR
jgi:hypothetical protein